MIEDITKAINKLSETKEKRNFTQTIDLVISLKGIDLKKPESKFSEDVILPHGRGRDAKIVVFSDNLENLDAEILSSSDVQKYTTSKKMTRKLANKTDFFLSEAPLMPLIGKSMGQILSPRNKMPKVLSGDVNSLVKNYKRMVRIAVKSSPVIQCFIGREDMNENQLAENIEAVLKFFETKLPRGRQNIGKVLIKYTMGKPVKIEVK